MLSNSISSRALRYGARCRPSKVRSCHSASDAPQRVALVTGGSRGIGRAICEALVAENYRVAVLSKSDLCTETASLLNKKTGNAKTAIGIKCDVSDLDSIPEAFKAAELALGPVDVLVNNAGIAVDGLLVRMKDEDMQKVMTTNLLAPLAFSREASKSMMRRKTGGDIVMIGSMVGDVGNVGQVVYASTKAGLIGATKSMALELGKKGIRTNLVSPGFVETDMTSGLTEAQLKGGVVGGKARILAPEDVASEVMKLLRSANSNGEILTVGSL